MGARSNGCISCKGRRVKCDEAKPTCQRCHKAGVTCKGYQPLTFIDENPRIERANAVARSQQERHCALRRNSQQLYHSSNARANPLSPTLPLTAFKKNIFISFLVTKMYEGRTQYEVDDTKKLAVLNGTQGWWVGEMIKTEPSKALEALAAMFFGKVHRQDDAKIEAFKIYSTALPKLRADLLDNVAMWSFDTLASMTTLCIYELVAYRSGFEWNWHAGGLCRLIELRGPWRHKNYPEKSVFLEHRTILLSRAMVSRRKSFLCQRIWKEVPWEDDPKSKQPVDYLMDILCDVTALIEDTDKFINGDKKVAHIELINRVANAFNELNDWWHDWIHRNGHTCKEVPSATSSTLLLDEEGFLFPTLLVYDTFWIAYTLCIHNATRIQLLGLWDILSRTHSSASSQTSPQLDEPNTSPLLGITSDAESLAREILRSIEYCHYQSRHHLGTFCLLFPLDFAYGVLGMYSREARWLWANDEIEVAKIGGFDEGRSIMRLLPTYHFDAPLHRGVKSPNRQRFRDKVMATSWNAEGQAA